MTIEEIREEHKLIHGSRKVQKQTLVERLEQGRSEEDTINTPRMGGSSSNFYTRHVLGSKTTKLSRSY